ncbi:uncharacterized protein LOC128205916 isoform X2 [Mya arenaria]|uniref:uncharacterized protein LOC128205916 isoform X2 n=1 Tax=Mya arenaria TaxID=6604 RepID=UPI0022DFAFB8|nr:uncharacterized protein LOC128205916 isoform X2 [Mya arenaria]
MRVGEHLGSEDRSTEFKEGPRFIENDFRPNVAKYVSAFINSHKNGTLYIGVDDTEGYRSGWYSVVICIVVQGSRINTNGQLYSTLQGTFERRDGGVHTLNTRAIHNFYKKKYQSKRNSLEKEIQELLGTIRELRDEIEKLKLHQVEHAKVQGAEASKQTIEEIKKLRTIIESQPKKSSKVCTIS